MAIGTYLRPEVPVPPHSAYLDIPANHASAGHAITMLRLFVVAACLAPVAASAQLVPNLDFENSRAAADGRLLPVGWTATPACGCASTRAPGRRWRSTTCARADLAGTTAWTRYVIGVAVVAAYLPARRATRIRARCAPSSLPSRCARDVVRHEPVRST